MTDPYIRSALRNQLADVHKDEAATVIVEELGLCAATCRVDVAVINGSLTGFEIKSERDTLQRLPSQSDVYSRVFDYVSIVYSGRNYETIASAVPEWWGLIRAEAIHGRIMLATVRPQERNKAVDPFSVVQLLWRDEALDLLKEFGIEKGLLTKPKPMLWRAIAEALPLELLCERVRSKVKSRSEWRVGSRLM